MNGVDASRAASVRLTLVVMRTTRVP